MLFGSEASEQQRLSRGAIVHFFALQGPQSRNNQELLCCCYLALGHFWPLNLLSTLNISSHLNARPPTTFDKSSKWDRLILFSWNFSWAYTNKARVWAERFQLLTRISKWVKCSRLQLWTPNFFSHVLTFFDMKSDKTWDGSSNFLSYDTLLPKMHLAFSSTNSSLFTFVHETLWLSCIF